MKKTALVVIALVCSFYLGFAFNSLISKTPTEANYKVNGIGGLFFKCKNPAQVRAWYEKHLGLSTNQYGAVFEWYQGADSTRKGFTQWSPFKETTTYFQPSTKEFMVNYRVGNLKRLVADLKQQNVTVLDTIESYSYGKFVQIMDIEGTKIELWEPNDADYEKMGLEIGYKTVK